VRGPTGIGDLQSPLLLFPDYARHSLGPANKFADPGKDPSPLSQNENCREIAVAGLDRPNHDVL